MADAICEGATAAGASCDLIEAKDFQSIGKACALAVGSSTRMKRPLPRIRQILADLKDLNQVPVAAFGSYGWSGEAPDEIADLLRKAGGSLVEGQPIKAKDYPDESALEKCRNLGRSLVELCK
jgi:flavorubredoxin